jgi:hypothetical protein
VNTYKVTFIVRIEADSIPDATQLACRQVAEEPDRVMDSVVNTGAASRDSV